MYIIGTDNQHTIEINMRLKEKEIQESKMVTCCFISRSSPDWNLQFGSKVVEEDTNKARIRYQGKYEEIRENDHLKLFMIPKPYWKVYKI